MKPLLRASAERLLAALASDSPTPGGGSAAAVTAALGAALAEMAARINSRRSGNTPRIRKGVVTARVARIARLRRRIQKLVTEDAEAFERFSGEFRSSRVPERVMAGRRLAGPPLELAALCADCAVVASAERKATRAWLMSDLKESLLLLRAGHRAAELNVETNLNARLDPAFARRARRILHRTKRRLEKAASWAL